MKYAFSDKKRALICSWNQLDWTKIALGSETYKAAIIIKIDKKLNNNGLIREFIVLENITTDHDNKSV